MASISPEKTDSFEVTHKEGQSTPESQELIEYDKKTEKKLIRRIDGRLLPILGE